MAQITIYTSNGATRAVVPYTTAAAYKETAEGGAMCEIAFNTAERIPFEMGDYIANQFGRFYINALTPPTPKAGGWYYTLQLVAHYMRWQNRILYYDRQRGTEKSWTYTGKASAFMDVVVSNLKAAFGAEYAALTYAVADDVADVMRNISFDATSIYDGLASIAETFETEWWVDGNVLHLGAREFGTPEPLDEGFAIADLTSSQASDAVGYATRLYAFGGTKNLPVNYRETAGAGAIEAVVERRLKLPSGIPFVDVRDGLTDAEIVERVNVYDDIFPKKDGAITEITTKQYTDEIETDNGTTFEPWDAFRARLGDYFPNGFNRSWVIGDGLKIHFQSGKLGGLEFELIFNPDGVIDETSTDAQIFEIVRNDDYGVTLPAGTLTPAVGDAVVVSGFNIAALGGTHITDAENKLLEAARADVAKMAGDNNTFTAKLNPIRAENDGLIFGIGQRVQLFSPRYFGTGGKTTRVIGIERSLYNPFVATYTLGESAAYSRTGDLQKQIEEVARRAETIETNGAGVSVIGRYDNTAPTDTNAFSALRVLRDFARRNADDTITGLMRYVLGVQSDNYTSGLSGAGWALKKDANGASVLEADRIVARQQLTALELLISKIRAINGGQVISAAASKVDAVEHMGNGSWLLNTENNFDWAVGDIVRCQSYGDNARGYFAYIVGVYKNGINVFKTTGDDPAVGDDIVQWGNRTDTARQSIIYLTAADEGAPYIDIINGLNKANGAIPDTAKRTRLGLLDGLNKDGVTGYGLYSDNAYLGDYIRVGQLDTPNRNYIADADRDYTSTAAVVSEDDWSRLLTEPMQTFAGKKVTLSYDYELSNYTHTAGNLNRLAATLHYKHVATGASDYLLAAVLFDASTPAQMSGHVSQTFAVPDDAMSDAGVTAAKWFVSKYNVAGDVRMFNFKLEIGDRETAFSLPDETIKKRVTRIDDTGIYTGFINAEQITAGTIDADRINADALVARQLQTTNDGGFINAVGNVLTMSESNGATRLIVTGNSLSRTTPPNAFATITTPATPWTGVNGTFAANVENVKDIATGRIKIEGDNNTTFNNSFTANVDLYFSGYSGGVRVGIRIMVGDVVLTEGWGGANAAETFARCVVNVPSRRKTIAAKSTSYDVKVQLIIKPDNAVAFNSITATPASFTCNISATYESQCTEIARDGFRCAITNDQYLQISAGGIIARFGQYALTLDFNGVRATGNYNTQTPTWKQLY